MLVEVEPPIIGQPYGLGGRDIAELIVSARYQGDTFFPTSQWPCHVYVARILDAGITKGLAFTKDQVEVIAWAMLFRTIEEAGAAGYATAHGT